MFADCFHQVGQRQGRRGARFKQLPDRLPGRCPLHFFLGHAGGVTERSSLGNAGQKVFLVQSVQRRHHRGVGDIQISCLQQFAYGGIPARPDFSHQALFKRSELGESRLTGTKKAIQEALNGSANCTASSRANNEFSPQSARTAANGKGGPFPGLPASCNLPVRQRQSLACRTSRRGPSLLLGPPVRSNLGPWWWSRSPLPARNSGGTSWL